MDQILIDAVAYDRHQLLHTPAGQIVLREAHAAARRAQCLCGPSDTEGPQLVIRPSTQGRYHFARMPGDGLRHFDSCPAFGQTMHSAPDAIKELPDGMVRFNLSIPLSKSDAINQDNATALEERERAQKNMPDVRPAAHLRDLLCYLITSAELHVWRPYFRGHRTYGVVRSRLLEQAESVMLGQAVKLSDRIYIPPQYTEVTKGTNHWEAISKICEQGDSGRKATAVVIGEIKQIGYRTGSTAQRIVLSNAPNLNIWLAAKGGKPRLKNYTRGKSGGRRPRLLVAILATASTDGNLRAHQICILPATYDFIPAGTEAMYALLDSWSQAGAIFTRHLPLGRDDMLATVFESTARNSRKLCVVAPEQGKEASSIRMAPDGSVPRLWCLGDPLPAFSGDPKPELKPLGLLDLDLVI